MSVWLLALLALLALSAISASWTRSALRAEDWPRWRGADGSGVASRGSYPARWSRERGVAWSTELPGEGHSSPIVVGDRLYLTSSEDDGLRRLVHSLDRETGEILWSRSVEDELPELTSSATGWAASTPAGAGVGEEERVVAWFAHAGLVAYARDGTLRWRVRFGELESELGFATSPIIHEGRVLLVVDHDGDAARSFDSFVVALELRDGSIVWKTERRGLFRSWSTPIVVDPGGGARELVVAGQDAIRGYDLAKGEERWCLDGLTGWVTPSPVFVDGGLFATSGKSGPVLRARVGGRGEVSATHVIWRHEEIGAYVTSPLVYRGRVYVVRESGVVHAFRADTGERLFHERLPGKFTASPVAADGKIFIAAEDGTTHVLAAADAFETLAQSALGENIVASFALADGRIYLRTGRAVYAIEDESSGGESSGGESSGGDAAKTAAVDARTAGAIRRGVGYLASELPRWTREKRCGSCHHQGDAARALLAAKGASFEVPVAALEDLRAWLGDPEVWERASPVEDAFKDPFLSRVQFTAALRDLATHAPALRAQFAAAAARLVVDQREDGSWPGGSRNPVGGATAYSVRLATLTARDTLRASDPAAHSASIARAEAWLLRAPARNVHEAAITLLTLAGRDARAAGADVEAARAGTTRALRDAALEILRASRDPSGGHGPYLNDAPEVFDTALVALALAAWKERSTPASRTRVDDGGRTRVDEGAPTRADDAGRTRVDEGAPTRVDDAGPTRVDETDGAGPTRIDDAGPLTPSSWIPEALVAARGYLLATQLEDGSWPETTRPPGAESLAQRVSTTAWALRALLASR